MNSFASTAAQGEVYIQRIDALPDVDMVPVVPDKGFIVVAHSERGNNHGFMDDGAVTVLERPETPTGLKVLYAIVKEPTALRQNATTPHDTVLMEEGIYALRIAREYDPFMEQARRVVD